MTFYNGIVFSGEISDKVVFFDVEGTLTPESLDTIAERFGILDEIKSITSAGMQNMSHLKAFKESVEKRLDMLITFQATTPYTGLTLEYFNELGREIMFYEGVEELVRRLKKDRVSIVLISGGLEPFVSEIAKRVSADAYICNRPRYRTENGIHPLTGKITCYVDGNKDKIVSYFMRKYKIEKAAYLGDGSNDAKALSMPDILGIAPCISHGIAKQSADITLTSNALSEAYGHIKKYFGAIS